MMTYYVKGFVQLRFNNGVFSVDIHVFLMSVDSKQCRKMVPNYEITLRILIGPV